MGAHTTPASHGATTFTTAEWDTYIKDNTRIGSILVLPGAVADTANLGIVLTPYVVSNIGTASADGSVYFVFRVPALFTSIQRAYVVAYDDGATGNLRYSVVTNWGANGEAYNLNTDSIAATTLAMTQNAMTEVDISAAFTGIAAGDYVGLRFNRLGSDALDTMGNVRSLFFIMEF